MIKANKCNNCKHEPCRCGRPKRQFDAEDTANIEDMARDNHKTGTIAEALNLPYNTLDKRFGKRMTHWRALGQRKLKTIQKNMAPTSPQMAIWLGKQDLGQVDKQTIQTEQVESKSKTGKELAAIKAGAKAYADVMARMDDKPRIVPLRRDNAV